MASPRYETALIAGAACPFGIIRRVACCATRKPAKALTIAQQRGKMRGEVSRGIGEPQADGCPISAWRR